MEFLLLSLILFLFFFIFIIIYGFYNQYESLKEDKKQCQITIKQLTEEINQQTSDCKIGPWCEDCKHRKTAPIDSFVQYKDEWHATSCYEFNKQHFIYYCGKHLHEICPERESKN